jgi:hypothetical protein
MINTKFMNKIKILVISGLMFFSGTYLTAAQAAISLSSNLAEARIVAPLGFTVSGTLSFGQIAKPAVGAIGTVILNPETSTRALTNVTNVGAADTNDGFSLPTYTVTGEEGLLFTLTLPSAAVEIKLSEQADAIGAADGIWSPITGDGSDEMNITAFTSFTANDTDPITTTTRSGLIIGATTAANEYVVGATLTVASDQATGYYRGTYTVTAQYD